MRVPAKAWKWLGVAGLAGVAATGAVVVRDQRQRRQMTPDEVRTQLRRRLADLDAAGTAADVPPADGDHRA